MEYERIGLLLPERTQPQLDDKIFESYEYACQGYRETYKDLKPSDDKKQLAKERWPFGEDVDLSVNSLTIDGVSEVNNSDKVGDLGERQSTLRKWKKELIDNNDINPNIKQLYRWKINENIANIGMLIASRAGDMPKFRRWNEYIYGKPNEDIYKAALDWVATDAEKLLSVDGQSPVVVTAAEKVVKILEGKRGDLNLLIPDEDVFEYVRKDHINPMGYYGLLLAGVEIPDGKVNSIIGDPIIKYILEHNLKSDYTVADASGPSWGISHKDKTIERPALYNMLSERFVGLSLGHEIGSHQLEEVNGERGPLAIMSVGADRYEGGNEGRAVIREQVRYKTFDEFGKLVRWRDIMRRHIAISYACGVGEDGPKRSADVYAFMNAIDTMYQSKLSPDDSDKIKEKAAKKTADLLVRVLKGTDGTGGAYLKDKVYLEGHVACWRTALSQGPEAISNGDLGKFDINNPRHIAALHKFGLLPDNE